MMCICDAIKKSQEISDELEKIPWIFRNWSTQTQFFERLLRLSFFFGVFLAYRVKLTRNGSKTGKMKMQYLWKEVNLLGHRGVSMCCWVFQHIGD